MEGMRSEGCAWELVPPHASHFAGVWERKVGSVKKVFDAAIIQAKNTFLSRDEFNTLLQESGSIVNHTPLAEISCDPTEPFPVSPFTLLTLRETVEPPQDTFTHDDLLAFGKRRWRRVQHLAEQFWIRWKRDYLYSLQQRNKWNFPSRNMSEGDVVLIRENSHRNQWPLGLIIKSITGSDSLVRRVMIRMKPSDQGANRIVERAIHDVVLLVPNT